MLRICALFIIAALCSCSNDVPDDRPNTILVAPTKQPRLNCYEVGQRVRQSGGSIELMLEAQADCIQENARRGY